MIKFKVSPGDCVGIFQERRSPRRYSKWMTAGYQVTEVNSWSFKCRSFTFSDHKEYTFTRLFNPNYFEIMTPRQAISRVSQENYNDYHVVGDLDTFYNLVFRFFHWDYSEDFYSKTLKDYEDKNPKRGFR